LARQLNFYRFSLFVVKTNLPLLGPGSPFSFRNLFCYWKFWRISNGRMAGQAIAQPFYRRTLLFTREKTGCQKPGGRDLSPRDGLVGPDRELTRGSGQAFHSNWGGWVGANPLKDPQSAFPWGGVDLPWRGNRGFIAGLSKNFVLSGGLRGHIARGGRQFRGRGVNNHYGPNPGRETKKKKKPGGRTPGGKWLATGGPSQGPRFFSWVRQMGKRAGFSATSTPGGARWGGGAQPGATGRLTPDSRGGPPAPYVQGAGADPDGLDRIGRPAPWAAGKIPPIWPSGGFGPRQAFSRKIKGTEGRRQASWPLVW